MLRHNRNSTKRGGLVLLLAAGVMCLWTASAWAAPATFRASSGDGSTVIFTTTDQMVTSDTDTRTDVYAYSGGSDSLLSANLPGAGNGPFPANFDAASADASHVFFTTSERLVPADTDSSPDVYERAAGVTTLVSTGPNGGNGAFAADLQTVSSGGTTAIFTTNESLVSADTDSAADIYMRSGGTTTLLSTGTSGGNAAIDAGYRGASSDGSVVFFVTTESLVPGDTDSSIDLYQHGPSGTALLSTGPSGGNGAFDANFGMASSDGSIVYFETRESLLSADTDTSQDVYMRSGGTTSLVSTGALGGNGAFDAEFVGASADGSHAFVATQEVLAGGDSDTSADIYDRSGGTTSLVSTGPNGGNGTFVPAFEGSSADGSRVFFTTDESLVSADTDTSADIYQRSSGTTTLVSTGPSGGNGAFDANFGGNTADGQHVFFTTSESLVSADTDTSQDVYDASGGTSTLVSTGPDGGSGAYDAAFGGVSTDGAHVYFETPEHLTTDDDAIDGDVFDRSAGTTTLISGGGNPSTAPDPPIVSGTNPASPANDNNPRVYGTAPATDTVGIYTTPDCSGNPVAVGSGSEFSSTGIQVSVPDDSTTSFRANLTDDANNTSACSGTYAVYVEMSALNAPVLNGTTPSSPSKDNTPLVSGSAPAGTTVQLFKNTTCSGGVAATGTADQLAGPGIQVTVPQDATTSLSARAVNGIGGVSACSNALTYVEDSTAPNGPALSSPDSSPANRNTFTVRGGAEAGSTVRLYDNPDCAGQPLAVGPASQLSSAGFDLTVPDNTRTEVHATAADAAGNRSRCSSDSVTYVEDSTAPRVRITYGPAFKTLRRIQTFRFADTTGDLTTSFVCSLDRRPFSRCSSPKTYRHLKVGAHKLRVKATDAAGNHQATAVKRRFKVLRRR